jgi:hypothetical protein
LDGYTPSDPDLHSDKGSTGVKKSLFKQDAGLKGEELSSVPVYFHMKCDVALKFNFFQARPPMFPVFY